MRLEIFQTRGRPQRGVAFGLGNRIRRNVEVAGAGAPRRGGKRRQKGAVRGLLVLGIKVDRQLDMIANLFADRVVVHLPPDARAGDKELAGVWPVDVVVLVDGPFHQQSLGDRPGVRSRFLLLQNGQRMMGNPAPRCGRRPHFDRAHPAWFVDRNRRQGLEPHVLAPCGHGVGFRFDHQIRFAAQLFGQPPAVRLSATVWAAAYPSGRPTERRHRPSGRWWRSVRRRARNRSEIAGCRRSYPGATEACCASPRAP